MDIFVGSLPFKIKEEDLRIIFEAYGEVSSVKIIIDKITRQNKGFGFVGMPNEDTAIKAIAALHGSELMGRTIVVNRSEDKKTSSQTGQVNARKDKNEVSGNSINYGNAHRTFRSADKNKGDGQNRNFSKNRNYKGGKKSD